MSRVTVKCVKCGNVFISDNRRDISVCCYCGKSMITRIATKYYKKPLSNNALTYNSTTSYLQPVNTMSTMDAIINADRNKRLRDEQRAKEELMNSISERINITSKAIKSTLDIALFTENKMMNMLSCGQDVSPSYLREKSRCIDITLLKTIMSYYSNLITSIKSTSAQIYMTRENIRFRRLTTMDRELIEFYRERDLEGHNLINSMLQDSFVLDEEMYTEYINCVNTYIDYVNMAFDTSLLYCMDSNDRYYEALMNTYYVLVYKLPEHLRCYIKSIQNIKSVA